MSEDDSELIGPDAHAPARVDRDRRAPRFSWTPAYETTFFRSLCDSVLLGLRENSSFKAEAWDRAAKALQDSHGASPNKSHLINKSDNARKRFRLWRGLREDPDFVYNSSLRTVSASEEAWKAHIEREPLSRALRGRPFDHEEYMEVLYPDVIGSGGAPKRIMKPRKRSDGQSSDEADSTGAGVLNLQSDAPASVQAALGSPNTTTRASPPSQAPTTASPGPGSVDPQRAQPSGLPTTRAGQLLALTPPDDTTESQARKRRLTMSSVLDAADHARSTGPDLALVSASCPASASASASNKSTAPSSPDKRRRTSTSIHEAALPSSARLNSSGEPATGLALDPTISLGSRSAWPHSEGHVQVTLDEVVNLLRSRGMRRWREEAVDLFFKDFSEEAPDAQLKVTETILSDEHKAMIFCKMPLRLRRHWVTRLCGSSSCGPDYD